MHVHRIFNNIFIFKHLGFNFTTENVANDVETANVYHKIIETFKYAYARRALLGDKKFLNNTQVSKVGTCLEYKKYNLSHGFYVLQDNESRGFYVYFRS